MDKYYYLTAQLPMLFFDHSPEITIDSFLEEAGKWMSPSDFSLLEKTHLLDTTTREPTTQLVRNYQTFEKQFLEDLVQLRKARRNHQEYKPSFPSALVKEGNPLEIERKLLHHRWNFIEELSIGHHFDLDVLSAYYLQLQILHILSLFNKEKGMKIFQTLSRKTE